MLDESSTNLQLHKLVIHGMQESHQKRDQHTSGHKNKADDYHELIILDCLPFRQSENKIKGDNSLKY